MRNYLAVTAALLVLIAGSAASAQSSVTTTAVKPGPHNVILGVDGEIAIPLSSSLSDATGLGLGVELTAEYPLSPMLSATGRIGFQPHLSKSVDTPIGSVSSHIHVLPILVGARYYFQTPRGASMTSSSARQGLFGAAELGFFWLFSGASTTFNGQTASGSGSDFDFGIGAGVGYQMGALSFTGMLHSLSIGSFGQTLQLTGVVGYQFAGL